MKFIYITLFLGLLFSFSLGRRIHESKYALSSNKAKGAKLGYKCNEEKQCEKGLICFEEEEDIKYCIKPEEEEKIKECLKNPICSDYFKEKFLNALKIKQYGKENENCDYLLRCNDEKNKSLKCVFNGKKKRKMDYKCMDMKKKDQNEPNLDRCLLRTNGLYCEKSTKYCFEYDEGYFCREEINEDYKSGGLCIIDGKGELFCPFRRLNKMNQENKCRCFEKNEGEYEQKCTEEKKCTYGHQCIQIAENDFKCFKNNEGKINQRCINKEKCELGATCEEGMDKGDFYCFEKDKGHYDQECLDAIRCVNGLSCLFDDQYKNRCFKDKEGNFEEKCSEGGRCLLEFVCKKKGENDNICYYPNVAGYQEKCSKNLLCLKGLTCKEVAEGDFRCLKEEEGGRIENCSSDGLCKKGLTCKQVGKKDFKCVLEEEGEYEKKCAPSGICKYGLYCKSTEKGDLCLRQNEGQYLQKCSENKICIKTSICLEFGENDFRCFIKGEGNEGQICAEGGLCSKGNACIEVAENDFRCLKKGQGKEGEVCAIHNLCSRGNACALMTEKNICLPNDDVGGIKQYCFVGQTCNGGLKCLEYLNLPTDYGTNFLCSNYDEQVLFKGFETSMGKIKDKKDAELCKENSVLDRKNLPFYVYDKPSKVKEFICREHQTVPICQNDEDCNGMPKINNHFPKCRQYKSKPKKKFCFYSSFKEVEPEKHDTFQEVTPYIFLKRCNVREDCGDDFFYCIKLNPNDYGYCTNLVSKKPCDEMKETFLMNPFYEDQVLVIEKHLKTHLEHRFCVPHQERSG